jgi:AbrB family transcriptional regulator (stage V sporulation protein T)
LRATGIVRKIDNLGRVVIPKEIRKKMQIDNGNTLEIFVDKDETVILKKYSPVRELENIDGYIDTLEETTNAQVIITDTDKIVATSAELNEYSGHFLGNKIQEIIESRKSNVIENAEDEDLCVDFRNKENELGSLLVTPIIKQGDILGAVILSSTETDLGDFEQKINEITAKVISKKLGL